LGSISLTRLDDRKWSEPGPIKPSELFLARYRRGKCHREIPDREVRRDAIEIMLSPVARSRADRAVLRSREGEALAGLDVLWQNSPLAC
jgi:hypothetical protein